MTLIRCSIVIPAHEEGIGIVPILERIRESIDIPFECIVVVDRATDSTVKYVAEIRSRYSEFRTEINTDGPGPAAAIKFGILKSKSPVIVVTMADGSDDPEVLSDLVRLVERGVVIAAASRYMPGGQQIGAPALKGFLSKIAGMSLFIFRRVGTRDATNSFKAFSKQFLSEVGIESEHGFEIALELVAKAKRRKLPVAEVPTIWLERNFGNSNFKLWLWLPRYLRWYLYAFGIGKETYKS